MALTDKEKRFCEEYVIDLNATQAATRAGYSAATARQIGSENLTKLDILEYLGSLQKEISDRNGNLAQRVIEELSKVGFSNIQDFTGVGNEVKDLSEIDPQRAAAIAGVKKSTTTFGDEKTGGVKEVVEFKLWDKVAALEKLGRHLGIFEIDNKQKSAVINVNITDDDNG